MKMNLKFSFDNVQERIPKLIDNLDKIKTEYPSDRQYIGEAISFLRLLQDLTKFEDHYEL